MTQTTTTRDEAVHLSSLIRREIDHALSNDTRLAPVFGQREGDPAVRISALEAALASTPAPASGGVDAVALPDDLFSHQASWRAALVLARDSAPPAREDFDDRAYWQHELDAFDRVYASLSPAATPGSEAEPVAWRYRVKRWHDGKPGPWKLSDEPDTPSLWTSDAGYEVEALLAKPASSPAGGDVREALERILKHHRSYIMELPGAFGVSDIEFAERALSQSTSAGRVGE